MNGARVPCLSDGHKKTEEKHRLPDERLHRRGRHEEENVGYLCTACFWVGVRPRDPVRVLNSDWLSWGVIAMLGWLAFETSGLGTYVLISCIVTACGCSLWRRLRRVDTCPSCGMRQLVSEEHAFPPNCAHFLFCAGPAGRRVNKSLST